MDPGWTSETIFRARPPLVLTVSVSDEPLALAVDLDAILPLLTAILAQSILGGPPLLSPVASKEMAELSDALSSPFTGSSTVINGKPGLTDRRAGRNLERSSGPAHWCLRMRKWVQHVKAACGLGRKVSWKDTERTEGWAWWLGSLTYITVFLFSFFSRRFPLTKADSLTFNISSRSPEKSHSEERGATVTPKSPAHRWQL